MDDVTHLVEQFGTNDEAATMSRGRVVKVRFADQPEPNVFWFWLPIGNCAVCLYYRPMDQLGHPKCLHSKISNDEMLRYAHRNTCPAFRAGTDHGALRLGGYNRDRSDVMKTLGLVPGEPDQRVEVLQNVPWDPETSALAHAQRTQFHAQAQAADAGNEATDYGDLYPDLGHIPVAVRVLS